MPDGSCRGVAIGGIVSIIATARSSSTSMYMSTVKGARHQGILLFSHPTDHTCHGTADQLSVSGQLPPCYSNSSCSDISFNARLHIRTAPPAAAGLPPV